MALNEQNIEKERIGLPKGLIDGDIVLAMAL